MGIIDCAERSDDVRAVIAEEMPEDRIILETDAPYLAPVPMRGRRNEPALVVETLTRLADVRGLSLEQAAELTFANATRLFG